MKHASTRMLLGALTAAAVSAAAPGAIVNVGDTTPGIQPADLIDVSVTWTANNVYRLRDQIYVTNGATLTIEAGTVIASVNADQGSLAITRGCKIFANGTCDNPIIFTSTADVATWDVLAGTSTGKNPKTGTWRAAANEWGNITIMGKALIGDSVTPGNSASCGNNVSDMEGLTDPGLNLYGGTDDDDSSGSLSYVSLRYGGKVVGLATELNGLSLGAVGRATNIDHVDIMNNVDDGIEIWGGTVNLKYVNIWNIGDDSVDTDQGWRGKAQFGLICQGYSVDANQGSGVGDNIFEMDGAEKADAQPVTTATIYNFTVVGQPVPNAGDHGTAWRDGARVQYRNSIFMDLGDRLISNDTTDGDSGSVGYGFNGTLTFSQTWTTPYTTTSPVNPCGNPAATYQAQSAGSAAIGQGFLSELTDSVFFRNLNGAYGTSDTLGVTIAGGSNPAKGNVVAAYGGAGNPDLNMPIKSLTRATPFTSSGEGKVIINVAGIDPRAANAAVLSQAQAPADGFYTPALYRGGFSDTKNWLCGWTAADAFGFVIKPAGSCLACSGPPPCPADVNGNGTVNIDDLLAVINAWGPCGGCPADVNGNGTVNIDDLLAVINAWGPCPQ